MRISIAPIASSPGEKIPFEFFCDLSDFLVHFRAPFREPVLVRGEILNEAGVLCIRGEISGREAGECDRCLRGIDRPFSILLDEVVAEELENPEGFENADVIIPENGSLDLLQIAKMKILVSSGMTMLCGDDCKGLCPKCGKDMNSGSCGCGKEIDPRLEKLRELLGGD